MQELKLSGMIKSFFQKNAFKNVMTAIILKTKKGIIKTQSQDNFVVL
jgi:hypothetical protein